MITTLKVLLVSLSLGLNIAFCTIWAFREMSDAEPFPEKAETGCCPGVSCPLHRQLLTQESQWEQIAPAVQRFQKDCDRVCRRVSDARTRLFDLLEADAVNVAALREQQKIIVDGQTEIQNRLIDLLILEKKILTPEQQGDLFRLLRRESACAGGCSSLGGDGRECGGEAHDLPHSPSNEISERP